MPTSLVIGNGSTLVNIDDTLNLKDLYWPFVGEANHLSQKANEIFFLIDGVRVDLSRDNFLIETNYLENSLVTKSTALSEVHKLRLTFTDFVLYDKDVLVRKIEINNLSPEYRELLVFFKHNYFMREDDTGNTATWYEPADIMCHYKKNTYLGMGLTSKIFEFTCSAPNDNNNTGASPDEYGRLPFNPVSTGTTQSCFSAKLHIDGNTSQTLEYFTVCGHNYQEITGLARQVRKSDLQELEKQTNFYWQNWIRPKTGLSVFKEQDKNKNLENLYARSLLIMRTQTDKNGAIVAANDSIFVKQGGKDSYSYMWPRDGANCSIAYIKAGYPDLAKKFFDFCKDAITKEGYLHHKYYTDLSKGIGSSWHPWIDKYGNEQLPIQEDETASVIIALYEYYLHYEDLGYITEVWNTFIVPALNFLIDYRFLSNGLEDNNPIGFQLASSHLPKPSYDLWEIHWGVHSYTVATVYQALMAGAKLAESQKFEHLIESCTKAAEEIKKSYEQHFYSEQTGTFINSIYCDSHHSKSRRDQRVDASMYALWASEMFDITDPRIERTMQKIEEELWVNTDIGGIARKHNDHYLQVDKSLPGNPWFISTLWLAQYWLKLGDRQKASKYIEWVLSHADHTGLLAEQAHPHSGFGLSMKPLTWSHAEFVRTMLML